MRRCRVLISADLCHQAHWARLCNVCFMTFHIFRSHSGILHSRFESSFFLCPPCFTLTSLSLPQPICISRPSRRRAHTTRRAVHSALRSRAQPVRKTLLANTCAAILAFNLLFFASFFLLFYLSLRACKSLSSLLPCSCCCSVSAPSTVVFPDVPCFPLTPSLLMPSLPSPSSFFAHSFILLFRAGHRSNGPGTPAHAAGPR